MIISNQNNEYKIIFKSSCVRELRDNLEKIALDYKNTFEVGDNVFYRKSKSKKFGWCPYGFFCIAQKNKISVFHKYVSKGYLYNADQIDKIMSFTLVEPSKKKYNPLDKANYLNEAQQKAIYFEKIHSSIRNKEALSPSSDSQNNI